MARSAAILAALAKAVWRELKAVNSLAGNNFFLFVLVLMKQPESAYFLVLVMGLLLLFPLSGDPLEKIPAERRALWPLDSRDRVVLRLGSGALNPVAWITAALIAWTAQPMIGLWFAGFVAVTQAAALGLARLTAAAPQLDLFRRIPAGPGAIGELIRKDLRQMLSMLDPYLAGVLTTGTLAYLLLAAKPDPAIADVMAVVVAIALSTSAQTLFGLDSAAGFTRYGLLPLRGWQILLAKDIAWLSIAAVLILPLSPLPGLGAALTALTVGHHRAVGWRMAQARWRFHNGSLLPFGLVQAMLLVGASRLVTGNAVWIAGIVALWAGSVVVYGAVLEASLREA